VKKHLSMVFHKFIDDGLNIYFKERKIKSWDPVMLGYAGLQPKPESKIEGDRIALKGFVLPHRSKLDPEGYEYGKGPKDSWISHQGFYIYRNNRLLVAGDWLGLFKKEIHYDLCRIGIYLPNDLDEDWQIDIKKSVARPPLKHRDKINSIAKDTRAKALDVYRNKGQNLKRKVSKDQFSPLWESKVRHGKIFYTINREHHLISELLSKSKDIKKDINTVFRFIEETVPVPSITYNENKNFNPHGIPFEGSDNAELLNVIQSMYDGLINKGKSSKQAKLIILNIEPYSHYPEYVEKL